MTAEQLVAFAAFAAITSITPGPNNMMVMASGLNHGFRRTLPHLAGIGIGFSVMVIGTGLGLHAVFVQVPALQTVLKYVGAAYLLWLAWQLARSGPADEPAAVPVADGIGPAPAASPAAGPAPPSSGRPMRFIAAAAFQWVNPKAWVMAIGAVTTYLPPAFGPVDAVVLGVLFGVIGSPCVAAWAAFGVGMRRVLHNPRAVRVFNRVAAALLVASLVPMLLG